MRLVKTLFGFAALLTLLIAMLPVPSVLALTGSEIAVTPGFVRNVPPATFTESITLANVTSLIGYDVVINYNQTLLNAVHVGGGNVFACVSASPPCGTQVLTAINSTTQTTGTIEVSQVILSCATCSGFASVTNSTLFTITFAFQSFGSSPITISRVALTGLVGGVVTALPTPIIVNGLAVTPPPASASLIKWKDHVAFHHLSISSKGNVQSIDSNVGNEGLVPAFVKLNYIVTSAAGGVTTLTSSVVLIPVGGTMIVSTSYTVPPLPVRYFVFANLLVSGDGSLFILAGSTDTFSYAVVS